MGITKHPFLIALVLGIISSGIFFAVRYRGMLNIESNASQPVQIPIIIPTSTPIPALVQESKVSSPDNKVTIDMKNTASTYTLSLATPSGIPGNPFYTKTLDVSSSLTLPFNAWSPDDAYFFIQVNNNNSLDYLVFKASGDSFSTGDAYLDIPALFSKYTNDYTFRTATGWAAPGLVIVNTTRPDNTEGPSFWFDVPNRNFIQLATHFK